MDKLIRAKMPSFAIEILISLINQSKKPDTVEKFKFELADIYMNLFIEDKGYLQKAKVLYKDIVNDSPSGEYALKAKILLDEILMREGKLEPKVLELKYKDLTSGNHCKIQWRRKK